MVVAGPTSQSVAPSQVDPGANATGVAITIGCGLRKIRYAWSCHCWISVGELLGIGTTPKANRARRAVYGTGAARRRRSGIAVAPTLLRNLVRGRWLVVTIVVLLAAGVMVRLGIWQMSRLEGRRAANAA